MTTYSKLFSAFVLIVIMSQQSFSDTTSTQTSEYKHTGKKYPPVFFVTNVEDSKFKDKLESYQAFSRLDTAALGLPIGVKVIKSHRTKQDAAAFSSAMLSASTLGITPIVSNTEFKVQYDLFVQGKSITQFEYKMSSTDVDSMWSGAQAERETRPAEQLFLEKTLSQFLSDLKESPDSQALFNEYWEYFEE